MKMPEEVNRVLTDRVSKWLFCPTDTAVENLKKEGFENFDCKIVKTGDVMYDAVLYYKQYAKKPKLDFDIEPQSFILATVHREENTDNEKRLRNIFEALEEISREVPVIFPIHPRTKQRLKLYNIHPSSPFLYIIEPVSYLEMIWLLDNCSLVMTDSGGLQKEAYFFNKFCITLRDETEWVELVEIRMNRVVGSDKKRIIDVFKDYLSRLLTDYDCFPNLYGNGKASQKIIRELLK
jgi:UDP-GlcNAc3NAcA epimerase